MSISISITSINTRAPYLVQSENGYSFVFFTDWGHKYEIGFLEDYTLGDDGQIFQFFISALDNLRLRQDEKVKQTIIVVLEEFFKNDNVSILYICDSSDGRQAIRNRLFSIWFSRYSNRTLFSLEQRSLKVNDEKYFISLLSRNDCPATLERINTLDQLMHSLDQK